ncbi:hypothetical protein ACEPAH_8960 [Sanghuangporus vaninii]
MSQYLLNRVGSCSLFRQTQSAVSSALRSQTRSLAVQASKKPIPEAKSQSSSPRSSHFPRVYFIVLSADGMTTESFLSSIGRDAVSKVKVASWDELWSLDGHALKEAGLTVRDRRYILWCMEKFRQGYEPKEFAHPPTPKKKIRGYGPAVQNGKRIRSRRLR